MKKGKGFYIIYSIVVLLFVLLIFKMTSENSTKVQLVKLNKIPSFSFVNQYNKSITPAELKGKVSILSFFFTSCPGICKKMNSNKSLVQDEFALDPNFKIISISIDSKRDTPSRLLEYASKYSKVSNWEFLTGNEEEVFELANKGFNLYTAVNVDISGGFEHSGMFALIDKDGFLRSRKDEFGNPIMFYDGLTRKGISMLKEDIKVLLGK